MSLLQISEPGQENSNDEKNEEVIVGIDLGTTNSLIGIIDENEKVKFFKQNNKELIPSIVTINNTKIASIKRLMGKNFDDIKNQKFEYDVTKDEEDNIKIKIDNNLFSPEEISSKILTKLETLAEEELQQEVKKAVITVPAYFDEAAKNATKLAAKLAGLEVLRLVNEPTAAALAYGLENNSKGTYIIYDLGGGTFDVSILKMQKGIFKVLGVAGDNNLGGDDFDRMIQEKFPDLSLEEAKQLKHNSPSKEITDLFKEKIDYTINITTNLISDLDIDENEIDGVILVGGSSRISLIKEGLAKIFGKEKILDKLDPDKIVGQGAAWQAYNLSGKGNNLLLDVIPLSLGIEMMGGIVDKVILRNSTIPTQVTKEFTTHANNQTGMKFHIVQGERELASDCRSLANFEIKNIPPLAAGKAKISVSFKVDADGLLTVSAEELMTKQKQEIVVKPSFGLDEDQTKKMLLDSLKNSKEDIAKRLLIERKNEAKQDLELMQKDLEEFGYLVSKEEQEKIKNSLENLEKLLLKSTNREEIKIAHEDVIQKSEDLILKKVNLALEKKIGGKNLDEF